MLLQNWYRPIVSGIPGLEIPANSPWWGEKRVLVWLWVQTVALTHCECLVTSCLFDSDTEDYSHINYLPPCWAISVSVLIFLVSLLFSLSLSLSQVRFRLETYCSEGADGRRGVFDFESDSVWSWLSDHTSSRAWNLTREWRRKHCLSQIKVKRKVEI